MDGQSTTPSIMSQLHGCERTRRYPAKSPSGIHLDSRRKLMSEDLAVRSGTVIEMDDSQQALGLQRDPDVVLEEAAKAASCLKKVLDSKPKPVMMNGERYLEYED